jgi:hypothetical protein
MRALLGEAPAEETPADAPPPTEAAPVEPAPAPQADAPDPIAEIEARRAAYLQRKAEEQQAQRAAQAKTATEQRAEQARAQADAERALLLKDPLGFADKHGIDKKDLLQKLIAAGAAPEAAALRRAMDDEIGGIKASNQSIAAKLEAVERELHRERLERVRERNVQSIESRISAEKDRFPIMSRASRDRWLAKADQVADAYGEILQGDPDPLYKVALLTERALRQEAEEAARLLGVTPAGPTSGAPQPAASGAPQGAPSSLPPTARTITNELAASPAGKRPPPQTDEERDAEALRILGG